MSIRLFSVIFNHTFGLQPVSLSGGVGVDSAWKQEKFEVRKIFENGADSGQSTAHIVGHLFTSNMFY